MKLSRSKRIYCVEDARCYARNRMPKMLFDYVDGAAGTESANRLNCQRLADIRLQPRVLVNVDQRRLCKTFLGREWGLPFGVAPMGMCNLSCPGADLLLAKSAKSFNMPLALSTMSSTGLEEIAERTGEHGWFQLYVGQSNEAAMDLVERAGNARYGTLILTVDVPQIAPRIRDLRNGFKAPLKLGIRQWIDFGTHPRWSISTLLRGVPTLANFEPGHFDRDARRGKVDWSFLEKLRARWKGNLIVKGVLFPQDAVRIQKLGVNAVYVSNHGGRQLDSAPAAIDRLSLIRQAVGPGYPLLFDSGIRNGEDVIKALACGADFVMLGRALLYGLGADGERGLTRIIEVIRNEMSVAMAQLGCTDIEEINHDMLVKS